MLAQQQQVVQTDDDAGHPPQRSAMRLRQLWDVSSLRPNDGDVLIFTQSSGKWVPASGDFAPANHNHDVRYYTRDEINSSFAPRSHAHMHKTGGSDALTPADIGAAPASHTHPYAPISHSHDAATTSTAGFMSAADKTKLNGVDTGATANTASSATPTALFDVNPNSGSAGTSLQYARANHKHPSPGTATPSRDGWMSMFDKAKLDGIEEGANNSPTVTSAIIAPSAISTFQPVSSQLGTQMRYAREDHVHASPGLATNMNNGFMSATDKSRLDTLWSERG